MNSNLRTVFLKLAIGVLVFANTSQANVHGASLPIGATLLTFDEVVLPKNSSISNQYAAYGVTFSNAYYDVQGWDLPTGRHIANFTVNAHFSFFDINFSNDVEAASFLFITNRQLYSNNSPPGRSTFQAYLNGQLVSQFVGDTDLTQKEFGFHNLTFDQIRITPGGAGRYGRLDNLRFQPVPEPGGVVFFIASIGLLLLKFRPRD